MEEEYPSVRNEQAIPPTELSVCLAYIAEKVLPIRVEQEQVSSRWELIQYGAWSCAASLQLGQARVPPERLDRIRPSLVFMECRE